MRLASGNWSSHEVWPWLGVGEVRGAPRRWVNGENPYGLTGQLRCGTADELTYGLTAWPTPGTWHWCCTPYVSNPIIGVQDPPHGSLPGPFAGESPPAPSIAHVSSISVSVIAAGAFFPPSPASSSAAPAPPPAPPRPIFRRHHSRVSVAVFPDAVTIPPPQPSYYGSSVAVPVRPSASAPLIYSDVILTAGGGSSVHVPTEGSYRVAAVTGYSTAVNPSVNVPYRSSVRLGVNPASIVSIKSTSGGSSAAKVLLSSAAHYPAYVSHVCCVCATGLAYGGGGLPPGPIPPVIPSSSAGSRIVPAPAYISAVWVGVNAASDESFVRSLGYGSSSAAAAPPAPEFPDQPCVPTTCFGCVPTTLYATFSGSLARYGTVTLTYFGAGLWISQPVTTCNGAMSPFTWVCDNNNHWELTGLDITFDFTPVQQTLGNPFFAEGSGLGMPPGCPGAFSVVVSSRL